jgi:hypothetical protein
MQDSFIERNSTPTFELRPSEKPDMSPYLFHLTTEENLVSILSEDKTNRKGKIKAGIPRGSEQNFKHKIVCFTETPIFALDFFRYRWSQNRERLNLNYGIGFNKKKMVKQRGVYPAIYASQSLNSNIKSIFQILADSGNLANIINENLLDIVLQTKKQILPLLTPLFENVDLEGFMWEREWRIKEDFDFNYDEIEYICCPKETRQRIIDIVGSENIEFLENWEQYNEITEFIKTQENFSELSYEDILSANINTAKKIAYYEKILSSLETLKQFKDDIEREIIKRNKTLMIKKVEEKYKKIIQGEIEE